MTTFTLSRLLFITFFTRPLKLAHALPPIREKAMIELDISGELPNSIRVIPSEEYPGGTHYVMKKNYKSSAIIGTIVDAGQFVTGGDDKNTSRCVLVLFRDNGSKYIRIMDNYISPAGCGYSKRIEEYVRKFCEFFYRKVSRTLIKLDVLMQDSTNLINVEVMTQPELKSTYMEDTVVSYITQAPVKFTTQPDMVDDVIIGTVRFGQHVVDDKVDGLIEREVIWEGGLNAPIITIDSCYKVGDCFTEIYAFDRGEEEFLLRTRKKKILHL